MVGASFDDTLTADALQAGGSLFMYSSTKNKASFKDVDLTGAKVTGQLAMAGASFDGALYAQDLVGAALLIGSSA
jgi:hypothetical protein